MREKRHWKKGICTMLAVALLLSGNMAIPAYAVGPEEVQQESSDAENVGEQQQGSIVTDGGDIENEDEQQPEDIITGEGDTGNADEQKPESSVADSVSLETEGQSLIGADVDLRGYTNLAKKQTAELSEPPKGSYTADKAVDGDLETLAQAKDGQTYSLTLTFENPTRFNAFAVSMSKYRIKNFRFSYQEEGSEDWKVFTERELTKEEYVSNGTIKQKNDTFVTAQKVKFEMLEAETWASIRELEIYATVKVRDVSASEMSGTELTAGTEVELSSLDSDAEIYYTTDESDPSQEATRYEGPIAIGEDVTIKAVAVKEGLEDSNISEFSYRVKAVTADPQPGLVEEGTKVKLSTPWVGGTIYFTTDGSNPKESESRLKYTDEIEVPKGALNIQACCETSEKTSSVYAFFYSTEGGVPENTVITASSEKEGNPKENAIDADADTGWVPAKQYKTTTESKSEWIKLDLGVSYDIIAGLKLTWPAENGQYTYVIQTSNDDSSYRNYYADTTGENQEQTHLIPLEENCRYIRIRLMGSGNGSLLGLNEWEVYGQPSKDGKEELRTKSGYDDFDRVVVNPIPTSVAGVSENEISLNGQWYCTMYPQNAFWKDDTDVTGWRTANIPGDLDAQGFPVYYETGTDWSNYEQPKPFPNSGSPWWPGNNIETPYKRQVDVPADYAGQKVFLRIDKAFSYARVWVNGHYVRDHRGEYNAWDCDITDYVKPGQKNWVTISIIAEGEYMDDGKQYGFLGLRHARGILSDVTMYTKPNSYLDRFQANVDFDKDYEDATLTVMTNAVLEEGKSATVDLTLTDPSGQNVALKNSSLSLTESLSDVNVDNTIKVPIKWDAEHPNLYTLTADVKVDGKTVETLVRKVGFREVSTEGGIFKVNGIATKLRGVNYYTVYGSEGSGYSGEIDKEYLETLKKNNINYIRAAHYPLPTRTLELCDEMGIFVEQENSVTFVGWINGNAASDTRYKEYYLHTLSEMVEKDRSHPSIIMWSIGNESSWGANFQSCAEYLDAEEGTLPVKFSWGKSGGGQDSIDILSRHYHSDDGLQYYDENNPKPVIWDEYAHGYYSPDIANIQYDPGYWDSYYNFIHEDWETIYEDERYMGGAIWCYVDNYYEGQNQLGGNTQWGQIDIWGREKPSIYNTKNIYSPVQYTGEDAAEYPGKDKALKLSYENRYETVDFADDDMDILVSINGGDKIQLEKDIDIKAKKKGTISIPAPESGWKIGDEIQVEFEKTTSGIKRNVETNIVTIGAPQYLYADAHGAAPEITEDESTITVTGSEFSIVFDKATGTITEGKYNGETILTGGPYLNVGQGFITGYNQYDALDEWQFKSITSKTDEGNADITIDGSYGDLTCTFNVLIDALGRIETQYKLNNEEVEVYEVGVSYDVASNMDTISWEKNGYFSYYPEDQIGRNKGTAYKEVEGKREWGVKPATTWKDDDKDFYNFGKFDAGNRGTRDFAASKTNIYYAEAGFAGSDNILAVEGTGTGSVHSIVKEDGSIQLNVNSAWGTPSSTIEKPHYKNTKIDASYSGSVVMRFGNRSNGGTYYLNYATEDNAVNLTSYETSIMEDGGTIQFITDSKDVKWEVLNFDGTVSDCAKVDDNGKVTALKNGYAVVKAVADETSGASAAKVITISGQQEPEPEPEQNSKGKVIINMTDKESGDPLKDVEFELRDSSGKALETLKTDDAGHAESGLYEIAAYEGGQYQESLKYVLVQTKAIAGYKLDDTEHEVIFEYTEGSTSVVEKIFNLTNEKDGEDVPPDQKPDGDKPGGTPDTDNPGQKPDGEKPVGNSTGNASSNKTADTVKTGDSTNIWIAVILLVVSACGITGVLLVKKKRKNVK